MLHRAGTPVSIPVLFSSGSPDGGVDWSALGPDGVLLDSGTVVVPAGAVSTLVQISGDVNTLPDDSLLSYRDVEWSYSVNGVVISDSLRYSVEGRVPFGASADGVRAKLGVEKSDLPDGDISLIGAYYAFVTDVTADRLVGPFGDVQRLTLANAIEALAALSLVPTMSVRIAAKETSGTNQYQRQKIDWAAVSLSLEGMVGAARTMLIPGFDPTVGFGSLIILARPAIDPLTGAAPV